jgi:uncharacterized protein (DUF2237 family)
MSVLNAPLHQHSSDTKTHSDLPSSMHAGMCTSNNPIAAILTDAFIEFASSNGADLRKAGVGPGQRFCLAASSWKSAADKGIEGVPKVKLESTHKDALTSVDLTTLKKWAAEQDTKSKVVRPGENKESWARESSEIGGKQPKS